MQVLEITNESTISPPTGSSLLPLALLLLSSRALHNFNLLTSDGFLISCNRKVLETRWNSFKNRFEEQVGEEGRGSTTSFNINLSYESTRILLYWFYTLSLPISSPSQSIDPSVKSQSHEFELVPTIDNLISLLLFSKVQKLNELSRALVSRLEELLNTGLTRERLVKVVDGAGLSLEFDLFERASKLLDKLTDSLEPKVDKNRIPEVLVTSFQSYSPFSPSTPPSTPSSFTTTPKTFMQNQQSFKFNGRRGSSSSRRGSLQDIFIPPSSSSTTTSSSNSPPSINQLKAQALNLPLSPPRSPMRGSMEKLLTRGWKDEENGSSGRGKGEKIDFRKSLLPDLPLPIELLEGGSFFDEEDEEVGSKGKESSSTKGFTVSFKGFNLKKKFQTEGGSFKSRVI